MKTLLFLLLASSAMAQFTSDPPMPAPPTANSTDAYVWWWSRMDYWNKDALKNRALIVTLNAKIAALQASLGNAATAQDVADIKASLASLTSTAAYISSIVPQPTNVSVTPTPTAVTVAWDYNSPTTYVTGFRIERSLNGQDYTLAGSTPNATTLTYTDKGVSVGTKYWYRVKAYSLAFVKDSAPSNVVEATP